MHVRPVGTRPGVLAVCTQYREPHSSCRDEIAGCIEKAYEKILFTEATRILFFNTPKKMTDYAKKVARVQGVMGPMGALTDSIEGSLEGHWSNTAQV